MLIISKKFTTSRISDLLHSSKASIRKRRGFNCGDFISEWRNSLSSASCHSLFLYFLSLSRNLGRKRSYIRGSWSSSWNVSERNMPVMVFSRLSPRALKKYAAIMWSSKNSRQWCKVYFINVDFPAPGLPLIHRTPLWLRRSLRRHHCWNFAVWNIHLQVSGWAMAMSCCWALMVAKLRERRHAIPSQPLYGIVRGRTPKHGSNSTE